MLEFKLSLPSLLSKIFKEQLVVEGFLGGGSKERTGRICAGMVLSAFFGLKCMRQP